MGAQVWTGSPTTAELMASFPFDFIYLDTEHTPYESVESMAHLVRAIESRGNTPWARVAHNDPRYIGKMLELGIRGIAVPHVGSKEEAERAVSATRFPPHGDRGFCPNVRRYDYGRCSFGEVEEHQPPQVFAMIEDFSAMPNLDEILSTDITGVFPGLADMSWTAEDPAVHGDHTHEVMQETFELILQAAQRHGKQVMAAIGYLPGDDMAGIVSDWHGKGVDRFTLASDLSVLGAWCRTITTDLGLGRS